MLDKGLKYTPTPNIQELNEDIMAFPEKLDSPNILRVMKKIQTNHFYVISFFIQYNVPFKIISLIETSQSIGGAKREYPGKTD